MNALNFQSMDQAREASRERWPINIEGVRYCAEHDCAISSDSWGCADCLQRDRADRAAADATKRRCAHVDGWFERSASLGDDEDLGRLPDFSHARSSNPEWLRRCDPRVIAAIRGWDLRTWLTVFAGTGAGKTSAIVARLHDARARALQAAQKGPAPLPPTFVFVNGYELGEATRRRRLGGEEHPLVAAALRRPLVILDELHPSHTPRDVVFSIIDSRLQRGLATGVFAGMSSDDFGQAYGAHTLRRLLDARVLDVFPRSAK
jgi:hypothetical protein